MAMSTSRTEAMPIIAISDPRLAIISHMRWAMKSGESLITVTLVKAEKRIVRIDEGRTVATESAWAGSSPLPLPGRVDHSLECSAVLQQRGLRLGVDLE